MRFRHVLLLVLAVLPAIPAFADETVDESQAILAIGRLGARIELDEKLPGRPVVGINLRGCHRFKNKDCHLLQPFRHLRSLDLTERKITDAGLKEIRELKSLTTLSLSHNRITDAGLKELRGLSKLTKLELTGNAITDAGLAELRELKDLASLDLARTQITDAGLRQLRGLSRLSMFDLSWNKVTDAGLSALGIFRSWQTSKLTTPVSREAASRSCGI